MAKEDQRKTLTIIFSSRVCDVELEVGNLIRIHPPWYDIFYIICLAIIIQDF